MTGGKALAGLKAPWAWPTGSRMAGIIAAGGTAPPPPPPPSSPEGASRPTLPLLGPIWTTSPARGRLVERNERVSRPPDAAHRLAQFLGLQFLDLKPTLPPDDPHDPRCPVVFGRCEDADAVHDLHQPLGVGEAEDKLDAAGFDPVGKELRIVPALSPSQVPFKQPHALLRAEHLLARAHAGSDRVEAHGNHLGLLTANERVFDI